MSKPLEDEIKATIMTVAQEHNRQTEEAKGEYKSYRSLEDKIDEILINLKVNLFHACCTDEDCDGYHPREDKNDEKVVIDAKQALLALIRSECLEVIGYDVANPPLGDFWDVGRNQLRSDQRSRLAERVGGGDA
jgi:hypothetical protein